MPAMTCSQRTSMPSTSIRWASIAQGSGSRLRVPRLADHRHLDRARVLELGLDPAPELLGDVPGPVVGDLGGRDDDSDLAARLDRERLLDALDRHRDLLEALEPLDVALHGFRAGARPGGRYG